MPRPKTEGLTRNEWALLTALAHHETLAATARAFGISPGTARNRAHTIYQKLGVHGPIEAFQAVGWLRPPPPPGEAFRDPRQPGPRP